MQRGRFLPAIAIILILLIFAPAFSPRIARIGSASDVPPIVVSFHPPGTIVYGQPLTFTGWANITSSAPQGDTVALVEYSLNASNNVTLAVDTRLTSVPFSFTVVIMSCYQSLVEVYAEDTLGNWNYAIISLPCVPTPVFSLSSTELQLGIFPAVKTTVTNLLLISENLTVILVVTLQDSSGKTVSVSTGTARFVGAPEDNMSMYTAIVGNPPGQYNATVVALSTSGGVFSSSENMSMIIA